MTTTTGDQIFQDSVSIEKNLSVGGQAQLGSLVSGKIKSDSILSKPEVFTFKVEGDKTKFYPIVFRDEGWADGPMVLEITRPNVHTDNTGWGALNSKFTCHSSAWGHGADFCRAEI